MTTAAAHVDNINSSRRSESSVARVRPLAIDVLILGGGLLYLSTVVFEGPLRFLLNHLGIEGVLYLRDGLLLQAVVFAVVLGFPQSAPSARLFKYLVGILLIWTLLAPIYLTGFLQAFVGWKIFTPLLFGIIAYERLLVAPRWLFSVAVFMFVVSSAAVIINYFVKFPWEGLAYSVADVEIEATREWTALGVRRLAGFSRTSFDAAILCLFLGTIVTVFARNRVLAVLGWLIAGAAIALTTTKGVVLAFLVVTTFFVLKPWLPAVRMLFKICFLVSVIVMITLPLTTKIVRWDSFGSDNTSVFLLSSFWARLAFTWPAALDLINDYGSWIVGRGLGGAGFPQKLFEPGIYTPGDNIFVYFFVDFGLAVFFMFGLFVWRVLRAPLNSNSRDTLFLAFVLAFGVYGIFCNMVESGVASIVIGATTAFFFSRGSVEREAQAGRLIGVLNRHSSKSLADVWHGAGA